MSTMIELRRGDVVLVAFPFVAMGEVWRKRRPAVIQADRYNRRRAAVILAAIRSAKAHRQLPRKVVVARDSAEGREGRLRMDSVVDCQTVVTIPRDEIAAHLGRFPPVAMDRIDLAMRDALGLHGSP